MHACTFSVMCLWGFEWKNPMKSMELFFLSPFAEEIHAQNLNRCVCVCVSMWLVYKLFRWNCVFIFLFFCRQMTTLKEMWISSFFSFIGGNNKKFSPPSNLRIQWHLILWLWWLNFLFCFVCFSTLELKSTHWNRIRIKLVLIVIWCWRNTQIFFLFVAEVHFNYTKCLLVNGLYVMRLKEFNFI